eukprot:scaffold2349_cov110-Cylindrotheca_fusiformis.AAC.6
MMRFESHAQFHVIIRMSIQLTSRKFFVSNSSLDETSSNHSDLAEKGTLLVFPDSRTKLMIDDYAFNIVPTVSGRSLLVLIRRNARTSRKFEKALFENAVPLNLHTFP